MPADVPQPNGRKHSNRKQRLRVLLAERDSETLKDWIAEERNPMRPLSSLLFDTDDLIRWRAIEVLGLAAAHEARRDAERVRRQIRRLFWLMNDESGGICWNAPEAIAEILYNVPSLIDEYGLQLPSFFAEEPFERGSRWAVARLAGRDKAMFSSAAPALADSLADSDGAVRGLSLMGLRLLEDPRGREGAEALSDDNCTVDTYDFDRGELVRTTVAELARKYLASF